MGSCWRESGRKLHPKGQDNDGRVAKCEQPPSSDEVDSKIAPSISLRAYRHNSVYTLVCGRQCAPALCFGEHLGMKRLKKRRIYGAQRCVYAQLSGKVN